jgi:hypothetical protein
MDSSRPRAFLKTLTNKAGELLSMIKNQQRIMVGMLTGHCQLSGHIFELGLVDILGCGRWKRAFEMV